MPANLSCIAHDMHKMYRLKKALNAHFELVFWLTAMLALAVSNPTQAAHFELCPLKLMGISYCPGCGLGHSISFIFHGRITDSWHAHWLGMPAIVLIFNRILFLFPGFSIFRET
jgi:hypothetical protein